MYLHGPRFDSRWDAGFFLLLCAELPSFVIIIIIIFKLLLLILLLLLLLLFQEFSSGFLEVHVNGNPQLVVELPPQSTKHKTLGVMINEDVSGKLALPQFRFFLRRKKDRLTRKDCTPVSSI